MSWNGSDKVGTRPPSPQKKKATRLKHSGVSSSRPIVKGILAGLIVILGAGFVAWLMFGREPIRETKPPKTSLSTSTRISEVSISLPQQSVAKDSGERETNEVLRYKGQPIKSQTFTTNNTGRVTETIVTADGKKHRKYHEKPHIFKHASDDLIAMILKVRPGEALPPIPLSGSIDRDFRESLKQPIEFLKNDSQEVRDLKLAVSETRELMRNIMETEGKTFQQVLADHERLQNNRAESHEMAYKLYKEMLDNGETDNAVEFATAFNEKYKDSGIAPLVIPKHLKSTEKSPRTNLKSTQETGESK